MNSDIKAMIKIKEKALFEAKDSDMMDKKKVVEDIQKDIDKLKLQLKQ